MGKERCFNHLDLDSRRTIENCVIEGRTLAYISREIGVDATSVSRELRRNRRSDGFIRSASTKNRCIHRKTCRIKHICDPDCAKKCSSCSLMCKLSSCADFEEEVCVRTNKAPWVCNGCGKRTTCPLEHFTYSAKVAQAKADTRLIDSREGIDLTGHEMEKLSSTVKAGLALGQSVHHIFASTPELPCSERSFYRHVENENIDVHKMELRKKVKYKKRAKTKPKDSSFYKDRTYQDYAALPENERLNTVQIDCVEGAKGDEQALLTLHFIHLRFQIYVLLKAHDSAHVVAAFDWLEILCGKSFRKLFGLILVDRGAEFSDVEGMERGGRCRVFYADPRRPDQKGACEKNHVELRKIIPKGTSLDKLTLDPWIVAGICSHVNSSLRLSIGDASPIALAKAVLPAELFNGLGLEVVNPKDVELTPALIDRLRVEREVKASQ